MLTMKDIVEEGHPALRLKAEPVTFPMDEELKEVAKEMLQFLINSQDEEVASRYGLRAGVGLAAPQINVNKQLFAMLLYQYDEEGQKLGTEVCEVLVNPKITRHSVKKVALSDGEGCLSVNREVEGLVPRPQRITLQYQDLEGNHHEVKWKDYKAIVAQHEIDHLHGIMFYDHIDASAPWHHDDQTTLI